MKSKDTAAPGGRPLPSADTAPATSQLAASLPASQGLQDRHLDPGEAPAPGLGPWEPGRAQGERVTCHHSRS